MRHFSGDHPRAEAAGLDLLPSPAGLVLRFSGVWRIGGDIPRLEPVRAALTGRQRPQRLAFDTSRLAGWDSRFLTFCLAILKLAAAQDVAVDMAGLPDGVIDLMDLARKVPERQGAARTKVREPFLARLGGAGLTAGRAVKNFVDFLGEVALACAALARGKAVFQGSSLLLLIAQAGVQALPIVSLISLLVGLILAFVGAIQLSQFGAQIYVSTIVGIAMIRVMGAIMTGIIMAGRTGAAYAAELGTMQVNEEIDALRTFGFSPVQFLVLPRMIALVLMMPLLCIYADLMGVLGGFIVGVFMLQINPLQYLSHTWQSVPLVNFWIGIVHSAVFGVLVALAGCYRGMRCGRSALAVGQATTSAVVTSILAIVIATAIITVACNIIGI